MSNPEKPPLGLMPESIFLSNRYREIKEAMYRYNEAGKAVPVEWRDELTRIGLRAIEKDYQLI